MQQSLRPRLLRRALTCLQSAPDIMQGLLAGTINMAGSRASSNLGAASDDCHRHLGWGLKPGGLLSKDSSDCTRQSLAPCPHQCPLSCRPVQWGGPGHHSGHPAHFCAARRGACRLPRSGGQAGPPRGAGSLRLQAVQGHGPQGEQHSQLSNLWGVSPGHACTPAPGVLGGTSS